MLSSNGWGAIAIDDSFGGGLIGNKLEVLEDPSANLTLAEVVERDFSAVSFAAPVYGYSESAFWFKGLLINDSSEPKNLVLNIGTAWIDHITLYSRSGEQAWHSQTTGIYYPIAKRPIPESQPALALTLPATSQTDIYLRIASSDALILPIYLRTEAQFQSYLRFKEHLYGAFSGLMILAAVYGLIFFSFTLNKAYLAYAINVFVWFFMFFHLDGYATEIFWKDNLWLNKYLNVLVVCFAMFFGTQFAILILETQQRSRLVYRISIGWMVMVAITGFTCTLAPYAPLMEFTAALGLAFPVVILINGIVAVKAGSMVGKFFLVSWGSPAISIVLFNSSLLGLIPSNELTQFYLHIGVFGEVILLSLTLAYHLRTATKEASNAKVIMETTAIVHTSLMKEAIPQDQIELHFRHKPCEISGGDLYNCLIDPRGKFIYIVIADVSGHGIPASIIASAFLGALDSAIDQLRSSDLSLEDSCQSVTKTVNRVMSRYYQQTNHFASMAMVGIDSLSGSTCYINAGHRALIHKSHSKCQPLLGRGSVMGMFEDSQWQSRTLQLQAGDMLLLFTDGLLENQIGDKAFLKERDLFRAIKNAHTVESLLNEVWDQHRLDKLPMEDDMTLIAVEVVKPFDRQLTQIG
ncbi:SpoIIE family protein phosphatase [Pseudobacteriovorax antillogorgiicola]|nr:SpoIIE family protein phosphatase [Pseudobacteriovorax antillogorgiicola]